MINPTISLSQRSHKTFPRAAVSDRDVAESSAGAHQKLIREGKHRILIIRVGHGLYDRIPLIEFDRSGVQA